MYIVRINSTEKGIVTYNSIKNLVIASFFFSSFVMSRMMLSQKFFDEICYKSEFYAEVANLSVHDVNILEVDFLCKIHFSIAVFPSQFKVFYQSLVNLCKDPYLVRCTCF